MAMHWPQGEAGGGNDEVLVDVVPGPDQRTTEDAVFAVVRAL